MAQIAVGGMAEIYSAKTAGVGGFEKLVALKVIHPNYSEDPDFVRMLVDEAKLAVHLQHANIVQTFDLGFIENQYYIAMELIDGIDLYKLLRRSSEKDIDFPFEMASFIAEEAAQGLDYAHRKRDDRGRPLEIVHRDISPQNILVSFDGEVKIVDFGIAKAARRAKQTAAGVIKGKYYYMSPEQAWGDPIDARTDIFSTGILLYEMLVGQMLYLEEDMDVLLEKVRKALIPKPSTKRQSVPVQLETLVMKALAKRPQDRFQNAGELATALARFLRARAPDFNRAKLAAWVQQVLGSEPTDRHQQRDPRISTAIRRAEIERDQNSLLFKLDELKAPKPLPKPSASLKKPLGKPAPKAPEKRQPNAPAPRRGDQATSPVRMPELVDSIAGDFEENDATIVDGSSETLMAMSPSEPHDDAADLMDGEESTRPMGPGSALRSVITGQTKLDDDPAVDDEPLASLGDEGDTKADRTSQERLSQRVKQARSLAPSRPDKQPRLPGVRVPGAAAAPRPQRALYAESGPLTNDDDDDDDESENTSERLKPTLALKPQPPLPEPEHGESGESDDSDTGDSDEEEATSVSGRSPSQKMAQLSPPLFPATPPPLPLPPPPRPSASPWPPGPASSLPTMLPLPSGLPILPSGSASPFGTPPEGASTRFSTDAVVQSLQPPRSRLVLMLVGGALLLAATVALFTTGSSTPPRGTIEVVSSPAGAEVRIDGTAIAQPTPLVITDVDPARAHHVAVGKKLYDSWESDVKFEGDTRQVRLQAVLVPVVASVEISSTPPGAEAIVNGRIAGTTPTTVSDLSPDQEIVIELRLRGYRAARRTFNLGGKRKLDVSIPLEKAR